MAGGVRRDAAAGPGPAPTTPVRQVAEAEWSSPMTGAGPARQRRHVHVAKVVRIGDLFDGGDASVGDVEGEDRSGAPAGCPGQPGDAVDQGETGGVGAAGEDPGDRVGPAHLLAELGRAGARSACGHLDRRGVGVQHDLAVQRA